MAGYIGKLSDGTTARPIAQTLYGTCSTAAATAAKVVTCADFDTLITGVTIHVKFTNSNTVANPTLNVNGTGAKTIYRYGKTAPSTSVATSWFAGQVVTFVYDGTYWQMVDWQANDNTTYSAATTSANGLMSSSDKTKLNGIATGATKNASTTKSVTLSASSWSSAQYTISDSLITASSNQEILPATSITAAQYEALMAAEIVDAGQSAGKLTLKALGTVPTIDIPIRVIFRGTI